MPRGRWLSILGWSVVALVVGALIWTFYVVGGPRFARMQKGDEQRVRQISDAVRAIRLYYTSHDVLPSSPKEVYATTFADGETFTDPLTGDLFDYRVVDAKRFELCATFEVDASGTEHVRYWWPDDADMKKVYKHKKGRQCFTFSAKQPE
jgi:hypothetical protein